MRWASFDNPVTGVGHMGCGELVGKVPSALSRHSREKAFQGGISQSPNRRNRPPDTRKLITPYSATHVCNVMVTVPMRGCSSYRRVALAIMQHLGPVAPWYPNCWVLLSHR
jgi:hypothetical protein